MLIEIGIEAFEFLDWVAASGGAEGAKPGI
jgi:hypothetical protein